MTTMTDIQTVPAQRRGEEEARLRPMRKYASQLMRRLWASDMDAADELVAGLADLGRVQLGRIIDNLLWTLANQPRPINSTLDRHIRMLWNAKMTKALDAKAEARLATMSYEEAEAWVRRLQALPDRPKNNA